ncbi:MAG: ABC transporter ATP-binding protein [Lachnospiraceae bacterium]|nr:ABC transporter ATP-binding protein [Lachnospiraceae bacterium]
MNEKESRFLSVEDLVVEYTSDGEVVHAVNGVSFHLDKGKTLGLVGETGAGKTTIAKAIMRILQEPPAAVKSGKVVLEGVDLLKLDKKEMYGIRGDKISMIFQDPMTSLNPVHKVGEQIAEVVKIHNPEMNKTQAKQRAIEMLERVGIPAERYHEYPHQFSGGMKQRVVIAMALACNPELLLADEPTSALDVTIQAEVLAMIKKLRDEFDTAMIMITHDLGIVAQVCDDVAIVYAGEILEYGSKEEIFMHRFHPYTIGLFGAIPQLDVRVDRLSAIRGLPPDPTNLPEGCHFHPRCPYATEECKKGSIPFDEVRPGHFCRCIHAKEGRTM